MRSGGEEIAMNMRIALKRREARRFPGLNIGVVAFAVKRENKRKGSGNWQKRRAQAGGLGTVRFS